MLRVTQGALTFFHSFTEASLGLCVLLLGFEITGTESHASHGSPVYYFG